jgi:hypothetical protein
MTALTAEQIATGSKNAKKAPPAPTDRPGRWRCTLGGARCHAWKRGTLRDAHTHYISSHYVDVEEDHGCPPQDQTR